MPADRRRALLPIALLWAAALPLAQAATQLPPEARQALQRAAIPPEAVAVVVHELGATQPVLDWRADAPMNPASLMKLPTTLAALDRLGPAFTWATPLWLTGALNDGVLDGDLVIQGRGDPKLVVERLWLALRQLRQWGLREIRGDIVLDGRAFAPQPGDPGDFDGERLRPYNALPAALLLNFRSSVVSFVPDVAAGVARVSLDTPLADTRVDATVPLAAAGTPCGDWRAGLKASVEPRRLRWAGSFPAACGERQWPLADADPASYDARLLRSLWQELGGTLAGRVREGAAPAGRPPTLTLRSPPLAEVVRDINKFSNNVMAQQLLLTLALQALPESATGVTAQQARDLLAAWLAERTGALDDAVVVDNGSGLSRLSRLPARRLARLLQQAADGPHFGELLASLPISGQDGTLRRSRAPEGRAQLKTGSLRDVAALAGYVLSDTGRRYVFVAMVNHPQAGAARPALDALVQWAVHDAPARALPARPSRPETRPRAPP
jgi:D-alanyl-D-alanine carboxypeptidase/D-alanyl-D-alanine-endopeptidase (penicillin-binding protein 4)